MQLHGLHHLTAVSADAGRNHDFYTRVLGMRLVKKTVNQDDTSAYHLFYADGVGSPGSDLTFFEFPTLPERRGTNSIVGTGLRVAGRAALVAWEARLREAGVRCGAVEEVGGRLQLAAEDPEGQRLLLVDDDGVGAAHAWSRSTVPAALQIRGLGPAMISVADLGPMAAFLTDVLAMRAGRRFEHGGVGVQVFEMGEGGPAAELHVRVEPALRRAGPGAGGAHHVAFRIEDRAYEAWVDRLDRLGVGSSGPVDRFYFRSIYVRDRSGILFEIATDGPGFSADEPLESMGEALSLPPFLEHRRHEIERGLTPL